MRKKRLTLSLNYYRFIIKLSHLTTLPLWIVSLLLIVFGREFFGIILGIVGTVIVTFVFMNAKSKINKLLADHVIGNVVKETFGDSAKYYQNGRVIPGPMAFPFSYDTVRGGDRIKAVYNGLNIELSDVELKNERAANNKEPNAGIFFRGQWLICDLGKELSGEIFVSAKAESGKSYLKSDVTMNHKAFDDCFTVKARVPEEAYHMLTPHMMEYILEMAHKANGQVYMAFLRSGKIHIAVNNNYDIFTLSDTKADYETLHQKFLDELRWFVEAIDALPLEDTLYKKEIDV